MITKKQKYILDFIKKFKDDHDYAPSLEEIKKHVGLSAVSTVHHHIKKLQEDGFLFKEDNQPRAISPEKEIKFIKIPILGIITAGQPIEVIETPGDTIPIPKDELKKSQKYYALKVRGNSMIEEGIYDGDVVVVEDQKYADNGKTVVAILEDNQATLKKIYKEKNRFRLQPANSELKPIFAKSIEIRGIVVKVIRQY